MPESPIAALPEVFVSNSSISKTVFDALERGELRKLGSRLYTRNTDAEPETLVRRNWYFLISGYYPDALIADRTALENKPAADGSVFLVSNGRREVELPGLTFRPRKGPPAIESDRAFPGGARLSSIPRAYLENMTPSRARGGRVARTLGRDEIEQRLDALARQQGEAALNKLRDEARAIASHLGLEDQFEELSALIGTFLGTRDVKTQSAVGAARAAGNPFDPNRLELFERLFSGLREFVPADRSTSGRSAGATSNLAFYEAYFSNFIEGTEFSVDEAREIVFDGVIPAERPEDAHDVLGTFRIVSDLTQMRRIPANAREFVDLLQARHARIMEGRPDKNPGEFKMKGNQAGNTVFVIPDLVRGTLERGFEFLNALSEPLRRAIFMMFLVSEVHPFVDGNGRVARAMMNAELVAGGQERIIIPTAYRTDYLGALKAISQNGHADPVIRMLDVAQRYTHAIDWSIMEKAHAMLQETNAFAEGELAKLKLPSSASPGTH
jgi:fido (protein-threonine AMPylation protein)